MLPLHRLPRASASDKLLAIFCPLSYFLGVPLLLLPLIVYLVMKQESVFVRDNAREALNFHLSWFFYTLLCVPLVMIMVGIPLLIALGLFSLVTAILAAVKSSERGLSYPLTIRLVR